jgi:hypothetical protein
VSATPAIQEARQAEAHAYHLWELHKLGVASAEDVLAASEEAHRLAVRALADADQRLAAALREA